MNVLQLASIQSEYESNSVTLTVLFTFTGGFYTIVDSCINRRLEALIGV